MATLIFWWIGLGCLVVIVLFVATKFYLATKLKRQVEANQIPVAHSKRFTQLPEYIAALRNYRIILGLLFLAMTIGLLSSIALASRPAAMMGVSPEHKSRDIMLCLDDSGSVLKADSALIKRFQALNSNLENERFGMILFNSSAVSILPLSSNYQLTHQKLKLVGDAFQQQKGETFTSLTSGTLSGYKTGTSLAGDGLATCLQYMQTKGQRRPQSIVLATDNEAYGKPIVNMVQAATMAKQLGIHVFVLDPGVSDKKLADDHTNLKFLAQQTGGGYYKIGDGQAINAITQAVLKQKPDVFIGTTQLALNDSPMLLLYISAVAAIASVILIERLK